MKKLGETLLVSLILLPFLSCLSMENKNLIFEDDFTGNNVNFAKSVNPMVPTIFISLIERVVEPL